METSLPKTPTRLRYRALSDYQGSITSLRHKTPLGLKMGIDLIESMIVSPLAFKIQKDTSSFIIHGD